jgi:hypothetical protein
MRRAPQAHGQSDRSLGVQAQLIGIVHGAESAQTSDHRAQSPGESGKGTLRERRGWL